MICNRNYKRPHNNLVKYNHFSFHTLCISLEMIISWYIFFLKVIDLVRLNIAIKNHFGAPKQKIVHSFYIWMDNKQSICKQLKKSTPTPFIRQGPIIMPLNHNLVQLRHAFQYNY